MIQTVLHALDLATAGEIDEARATLVRRSDPVAERLLGLLEELAQERIAKTRTQSMLWHEIGNALSIAQANLEGIMDGVLEPTPERYTGMRSALESVAGLLDDWRRPTQMLQDKTQIAPAENFNICAMIAAQATLIDGLARAKNVSLNFAPCTELHPDCVQYRGDPQRTGQILRNVLINAVRYTPPGGHVALLCDRPDAAITLTVSDSGPGIPTEDLPHIFDEGFRGKAGGSANGSGIGLSVVSRLLRSLGGNAHVQSEEGNGATFVIELPTSQQPLLA
ncbi:MAG: HAMP domain-containing histidine kinase [Candidatus Eremiobacteraeota bacterium]|nr:HAMP domain-containing histidine kinase [Candidatus Eremiobacteraeota bacterium]